MNLPCYSYYDTNILYNNLVSQQTRNVEPLHYPSIGSTSWVLIPVDTPEHLMVIQNRCRWPTEEITEMLSACVHRARRPDPCVSV